MLGGVILLMIIGGMIFFSRQSLNLPMNVKTQSIATSTLESSPNLPNGLPEVVTYSNITRSDTTAFVTGTISPNGSPTQYWYEYGTTETLGSSTPLLTLGSGNVIFPAPAYIGGLNKSSPYFFRLIAENQFGSVSGSLYSFRTTNGIPVPHGGLPSAKTLVANKISAESATIWGEVTPNKADTNYWFEYGTTLALGNVTPLMQGGNDISIIPVSIELNILQSQTPYHYRVNAQNSFGTVNGEILHFTTAHPLGTQILSPTVVTKPIENQSSSSVVVSGLLNPNGNETVFWFEYSPDPLLDGESLVRTPEQTAGSTTIAELHENTLSLLAPSTTYYVRMVAQNSIETIRGNRESFYSP